MRRVAVFLLLSACWAGVEADEPPYLDDPSVCGDVRGALTSRSSAIVNGSVSHDSSVVDLAPGQILAVGAIMARGAGWDNVCTGTLIATDVVLTAAHCALDPWTGDDVSPSDVRFGIGTDVSSADGMISVIDVAVHPSYDPYGADAAHDVAVLVLAEPAANQVPTVVPIQHNCTPLSGLGFSGEQVQTVGYGCIDSDCYAFNSERWWAVEQVIHVTTYDFTIDGFGVAGVCFGDSGGPTLWSMPEGDIRVMGVLSWGDADCGNRDHFVNIANDCSFIESYLPSCGAVDAVGSCEGNTAIYCSGNTLVERDCSLDEYLCGPDNSGNMRCLDPCSGETIEGRCDENNHVVWCESGRVKVRNCTLCNQQCGWSTDLAAYYCL